MLIARTYKDAEYSVCESVLLVFRYLTDRMLVMQGQSAEIGIRKTWSMETDTISSHIPCITPSTTQDIWSHTHKQLVLTQMMSNILRLSGCISSLRSLKGW